MTRREKFEADMEAELRFHIEAYTAELVRSGIPQKEAERRARLEFGTVEAKKDECRASWGVLRWDELRADLRLAARSLGRNRGFAAVAILSLALGIGANSAIFAVIDAVLLRPLPYPQSDRLVRVWEGKPSANYSRNVVNGWNYLDWRDRNHSFEQLAAASRQSMDLTGDLPGDGDPVSVPGMLVTTDFFNVLGVQPVRGRWFLAEESQPGKTARAIISYELWRSRYGLDPDILTRRIEVGGSRNAIVGVMPEGFTYMGRQIDVFSVMAITRSDGFKGGRFLTTVGRLKPGVTLEAAQADLKQVAAGLATERPDFDRGWTAEVVPMLADLTEDVQLPLLVLMAAVGFLLLVACANVANLLLMRGAQRSRELAVRAALGASRGRIARQLLTESLSLALCACAAGLALAYGALRALPLIAPPGLLPRMDTVHLDARVTIFTVAVSLLTTVLCGIVPSLRLPLLDLQNALKLTSRGVSAGTRRFRLAFVTVQVASALVLVTGAGLMSRSLARLLAVDPGFRLERILTMNIAIPFDATPADKRAAYFTRVLGAVGGVAGVESASAIHMLPLEGMASGSCYERAEDGKPVASTSPGSDFLVIAPGYWRTMNIALLSGRDFRDTDRPDTPGVVIVSKSFAESVFGSANAALGRRLNVCWTIPNPAEIAGVVADVRQRGPERAPRKTIYVSQTQSPGYGAALVVRTASDPRALSPAVIGAIHRVNPRQAVSSVRALDEVFARSVAEPRFRSILLGLFAGIALVLAAIGVYGVVAYSVTQRTREIGIRMALGATRGAVGRMILGEGAWLAAAGIAIGLAGSAALAKVIQSLLFELAPADPPTLAGASLALAAMVLLAALVPARRATRIAPVIALRDE